ncbi:hypothetical protein [Bdellovibrio sp. NC01]|uniref:hypothetical protein n=1 Tax=Bdellovibrio sp. NC01 TaxID=2220073 RepID=UPI00115A8AD7|nr:hypothetical protein [Bdellovibrio sp. NC01]QDK38948.1 hypothetical protein DOE51_15810 [Bdellovibrio sp. NC01]
MKAFITALFLTLTSSLSFATIPCTAEGITEAMRSFIDEQPICFSPCEAAKVEKTIYQEGLRLLNENCPIEDASASEARTELLQQITETDAALNRICSH